jgi:hypothetical protein
MARKKAEPQVPNPASTILINFVLDRSGSMEVVRDATIDGFNDFVREQRAQPGEAMMTFTMFDTEIEEVCRAVPIRDVANLSARTYRPDGCTALYDAIGHVIHTTDQFIGQQMARPDQVLFVIMTDGFENASCRFSKSHIADLIADRQERGYEFIYLGANQDSFSESAALGVDRGKHRTWEHSDRGQREMMSKLSVRVAQYRFKGDARMEEPWFEEQPR